VGLRRHPLRIRYDSAHRKVLGEGGGVDLNLILGLVLVAGGVLNVVFIRQGRRAGNPLPFYGMIALGVAFLILALLA
jgi:hypothetical protein